MSSLITDIFEKDYWQTVQVMVRWNGMLRNKNESLREHMYTTALFADFLVEEMLPETEKYFMVDFKLKVLRSALKHDLDEMFSGDILHHVKYNNFNGLMIRENIQDYVEETVRNTFDISNPIHKSLVDSMHGYHDECVEKTVKCCDWLSTYKYLSDEKGLGNSNVTFKLLEHVLTKMIESFSSLKYSMSFYHKGVVDLKILIYLDEYFTKKLTELKQTENNKPLTQK